MSTHANLALDIRQLQKTYPNGVEALKGINLSVKQGDFFALLGANGAGKSTTIAALTTLVTPTAGQIFIQGHDLAHDPERAKSFLGVVPQEINLNVFETCETILITQAGYYGVPRAVAKKTGEHLLRQLGLWNKRQALVRDLSGGMKRRLMIARALMHHPKVLLLDEPTAGVDIEVRRSIWDFLTRTNEQGTTIILTTHYLEEAEKLCKNIAILHEGRIIENTSMKQLLQSQHMQTLVVMTFDPIDVLPDFAPHDCTMIDQHTLEIRVDNQYELNTIFQRFNALGMRIQSVRTKTNRLEELFLHRISHAH